MKNLRQLLLTMVIAVLSLAVFSPQPVIANTFLLTAEGDLRNGGNIYFTGDFSKEATLESVELLYLDSTYQTVQSINLKDKVTFENGILSCKYKLSQAPPDADKVVFSFVPVLEGVRYAISSNELYLDPPLFPDVPHTFWAYDQISELAKAKVLGGYPDGTFRPDAKVSREEFAQMLVLALGLQVPDEENSSFADVKKGYWALPAIEAVKYYLPGYKNSNGTYSFRGNQPVLREDVATAIVRAKGYDLKQNVDPEKIKTLFNDYSSISSSLRKYIVLAVNNNIMSGYPDQTFRGQNALTRAEVAALLYKAMSLGSDNKEIIDQPGNQNPTDQVDSEQSIKTVSGIVAFCNPEDGGSPVQLEGNNETYWGAPNNIKVGDTVELTVEKQGSVWVVKSAKIVSTNPDNNEPTTKTVSGKVKFCNPEDGGSPVQLEGSNETYWGAPNNIRIGDNVELVVEKQGSSWFVKSASIKN